MEEEKDLCSICRSDFSKVDRPTLSENEYTCQECFLNVCWECVGFTSTIGIKEGICLCRKCFDYTCSACEMTCLNIPPRGICYFEDSSPRDICSKCRMKGQKI